MRRTFLGAAAGAVVAVALTGCGRPPLTAPGPSVTGPITVWGQRRISQEVRIEDHRVWGPDDDVLRFDDGYRGNSRFGQVSIHPCDGDRTCGIVGGATTSFVVSKDAATGHLHAEGTWGPRKFEMDLDENELKGTFGSERYFLKRSERPALFYKGKTGYDPYYEASIGLPASFLDLLAEEQVVYMAVALVR